MPVYCVALYEWHLLDALPGDLSCSADRRRETPLEVITRKRDDGSRLLGARPIGVCAALDCEEDGLTIYPVRTEKGDAPQYSCLVFLCCSVGSPLGLKFRSVRINGDNGEVTVALEDGDPLRMRSKYISPAAILVDVDIRDIGPGADQIPSRLGERSTR